MGRGAETKPTGGDTELPGLAPEALARLLDALPVGVGLQDPEGRFFWVNQALTRLLGMPGEQALGHNLDTLPLERLDREGGVPLFHVPRVVQGQAEWLLVTAVRLADNGAAGLQIVVFEDVTQTESFRRQVDRLQQALHGQVSTDEMTGLLNRRGVMNQLDTQVSRSRRYQNVLSVVVMRLRCPDRAPERPGLQAVTSVSRLLRDQTRWPDIIGRWDDQDFVLVLPETSAESAALLADKLRRGIAELYPEEGGAGPACVAEFGIAAWEKGDSAQSLMERAAAVVPE